MHGVSKARPILNETGTRSPAISRDGGIACFLSSDELKLFLKIRTKE